MLFGDWEGWRFLLMKKVFYLALLLFGSFGMFSCSTPEGKAKALIKEHMKETLYHPESYECASLQLDSAFAPFCSPDFHKKLFEIKAVSEQLENCKNEVESERRKALGAESSMSLWQGGWSDFGGTQYRHYKAEYEEHMEKMKEQIAKQEEIRSRLKSVYEEIKLEANQKPSFVGYFVAHRYRAKNNAGQTLLSDAVYIIDKDFSKILMSYDPEGDDYKYVNEMIEMIKDDLKTK